MLLRGDMDALPLQEDYVSDFQSKVDGAMHACGHDSHVAMLASAARLLSENKDSFTGKVRFMFQPGEEGYHGAKYMIEEGVLDGVDRAFAIHVVTNMPNGLLSTKGGALLASADRFEITVHGKGGHASAPHHCIDPIPPAAAMVGGLHNIVSRDIDPSQSAVLTVAHIEAGTTNNIIPASAFLEGTIRTFDEGVRSKIKDAVSRVAHGTSQAHGCTCTSEVISGYPVTINNEEQALLTSTRRQRTCRRRRLPYGRGPRTGCRRLQLCPQPGTRCHGDDGRLPRRRQSGRGRTQPFELHASKRVSVL